MPITKGEFPILEYDDSPGAIIDPVRYSRNNFPEHCAMTFFGDVLEAFLEKAEAEKIGSFNSEMKDFPVWKTKYLDLEICLIQAAVGSASIAAMTDFLIGCGVKNLIACGGCGVLDDVPAGNILLPVTALRDEGASYHYLPPKREIELNEVPLRAIKAALRKNDTAYSECKTWTTDGYYRETAEMVTYRKEEGCSVVEMECAAIAAVCEFRKILFGQLLYSGDLVIAGKKHDERNWLNNASARERVFHLSLESLYELNKTQTPVK